jgi:hypothetical protein
MGPFKSDDRQSWYPSIGKGVRKPREPIAKETTGGTGPLNRDDACANGSIECLNVPHRASERDDACGNGTLGYLSVPHRAFEKTMPEEREVQGI